MSDTIFTADQLAQVARADIQQTEMLRYWLLIARDQDSDESEVGVSQRRHAA